MPDCPSHYTQSWTLSDQQQVAVDFTKFVIQGGPAKVKPTYIFAGNIILVTFECTGKIQWFLANVITV